MAAQLHVANYINVENGGYLGQDQATRAGYIQSGVPTQTDLELNVGQPGLQILRLHSTS